MNRDAKAFESFRLGGEITGGGVSSKSEATSDREYLFYDPRAGIQELCGNLPHWRQEGALYFVTFRTIDALPAEKLAQWQAEKDDWLARHREPWDPVTRAEFIERFPRRLQVWLDAGHGECLLGRRENRTVVEEALRHFDGTRYKLDVFVVAANHVHAVVLPYRGHELSEILHSWKSYTAKVINRLTDRSGPFWQQESYDHLVRNENALERIRGYIRRHGDYVVAKGTDTRRDASSTAKPAGLGG